MTANHLVQVKEESVDTLHFDSQAFTDMWKTMIEKIKSLSSSSANRQRIAETSERANMQKRQKRRKKRKKRERERRRGRRRRRRRNGDASSWSASISPWLRSYNNDYKGKKNIYLRVFLILLESVPNFFFFKC